MSVQLGDQEFGPVDPDRGVRSRADRRPPGPSGGVVRVPGPDVGDEAVRWAGSWRTPRRSRREPVDLPCKTRRGRAARPPSGSVPPHSPAARFDRGRVELEPEATPIGPVKQGLGGDQESVGGEDGIDLPGRLGQRPPLRRRSGRSGPIWTDAECQVKRTQSHRQTLADPETPPVIGPGLIGRARMPAPAKIGRCQGGHSCLPGIWLQVPGRSEPRAGPTPAPRRRPRAGATTIQ